MSTGAAIAARSVELTGSKRSTRETLFNGMIVSAVLVAIFALGLLVYDVVSDGAGALSTDFFTNQPSKVRPETSGAQSAILGTIYLALICAALVVPLGVATAIYLEEYADPARWWNRAVEVNIQNLAAVPSVVYGILGLAFLVREPFSMGSVLLAGGITLGLLVLPVVIIVSREALRAVPSSITEGSLALGATQWQTIWKQLLPASIPGIATGVILALSRAVGETAPLLLVGAAASPRFNPEGLFEEFTALPVQILVWTSDSDTDNFLPLAAAAILVLMGILLVLNSAAIFLRNRYAQKW